MKDKLYTAISMGKKDFRVCDIQKQYCASDKFHPIDTIRIFDNFDEADKVAQNLADGKYPEIGEAGRYISMR